MYMCYSIKFPSLFDVKLSAILWGDLWIAHMGKGIIRTRIQWLPRWLKMPLVLCVSAQLLILPLQTITFTILALQVY